MDHQIREDRRPQGRKKLIAERTAYFQLMRQGYSNKEACRIVGINPRTGKVWRNGRHAHKGLSKARPPVHREPSSAGPGRYLRESERIHIADRRREKASIRTIAAELGRSPSTISREIRRNGIPLHRGGSGWAYRPHAAQARADARRPRPKPGKIGQNPELRDSIGPDSKSMLLICSEVGCHVQCRPAAQSQRDDKLAGAFQPCGEPLSAAPCRPPSTAAGPPSVKGGPCARASKHSPPWQRP